MIWEEKNEPKQVLESHYVEQYLKIYLWFHLLSCSRHWNLLLFVFFLCVFLVVFSGLFLSHCVPCRLHSTVNKCFSLSRMSSATRNHNHLHAGLCTWLKKKPTKNLSLIRFVLFFLCAYHLLASLNKLHLFSHSSISCFICFIWRQVEKVQGQM